MCGVLEVLCDRKVFSCSEIKFQIKLGVDGLNVEGRLVRFPVGVKIGLSLNFPYWSWQNPASQSQVRGRAISSEICGERLWEWNWILAKFTNDSSYVKIHIYIHTVWTEKTLRIKITPVESQTSVPVAAQIKA
jgi:hypothetical protein